MFANVCRNMKMGSASQLKVPNQKHADKLQFK
uniref:Uncharacterized protein n=1 Tax=Arundo donax TaxID=35708 RepID=A0A0A9ENM7_ARUDO